MDRATASEAWLRAHLGDRYLGCEVDGDDFRVELRRPGGRKTWLFGPTPEDALAAARAEVEAGGPRWQESTPRPARAAAARVRRTRTGAATPTTPWQDTPSSTE